MGDGLGFRERVRLVGFGLGFRVLGFRVLGFRDLRFDCFGVLEDWFVKFRDLFSAECEGLRSSLFGFGVYLRRVPFKESVRVPFKGSYKGSLGFWGF